MSASETTTPLPDRAAETAAVAGDLPGVVWQVWTAYLHAEPATLPVEEDLPDTADVTASVCIAGAWPGHVVLRGTRSAATAVAAAMMDLPQSAVGSDDVEDAMGELMNIIAGNVKSILPQPSFVSLPQVVIGRAGVVRPGATSLYKLAVQWDEHVVTIEVLRGSHQDAGGQVHA